MEGCYRNQNIYIHVHRGLGPEVLVRVLVCGIGSKKAGGKRKERRKRRSRDNG